MCRWDPDRFASKGSLVPVCRWDPDRFASKGSLVPVCRWDPDRFLLSLCVGGIQTGLLARVLMAREGMSSAHSASTVVASVLVTSSLTLKWACSWLFSSKGEGGWER